MKKLLALVLALVMTLGLATVGTNAAYADEKDINYDEAVTVLSTIGILKGDESGFRPGETLKRSEGAKIIAYLMLGNETAEAMVGTGTKFTDVPASHWAAGYIEYLTTQKVISGVGGGKFDPDGQLTTNQFAKMLLVALGFDAGIEGLTGSDWAINTQKLANLASVELFDGNDDAKGNEAIKREEAALYTFNVLKTPLVTYDSKGTEIAVNGAEIKFAASNWKYDTAQAGKNSNATNIYDDTINETGNNPADLIEFAEKYYTHLTLVDNGNSCDDLGRPVRKWNWYNSEIGTFAKSDELVKTWTAKVTAKAIYDELGKAVNDTLRNATWTATGRLDKGTELRVYADGINAANNNLAADGDTVAIGYVAGAQVAGAALDPYIHKTDTTKVNDTGNGSVTEVYMDKDHNVTIVTYHTYLFQAAGDYVSGTKTINIVTADDVTTVPLKDYKLKVDDFAQIADWKDGDYILVTAAKTGNSYEVQTADKAEIVSGKVTTYDTTDNQSVTLDGTLYKYGKMVENAAKDTHFTVGQTAKLVLDKYGYVMAIDEALTNSDYVFVINWGASSGLGGDARAKVVFADGTDGEITVKQAWDYAAGTPKDETSKATIYTWRSGNLNRNTNTWYTFSKNSAGEYSLYKIEDKYTQTNVTYSNAAGTVTTNTETTVAENNKAKFLLGQNYLADDDTIALVSDSNDDISTYTGVKNMPEILVKNAVANALNAATAYVLHKTNNYTGLVFFDVTGPNTTVSGGEGENLIYVTEFKTKTIGKDNDVWYTYKTLDGTETVEVQADKLVNNIAGKAYTAAFYASKNSDGQLTKFREVQKSEMDNTTNKGSVYGDKDVATAITYSGSTIKVGTYSFTVNSNTKVTMITMGAIAALGTDATDMNNDKAADYEVTYGVGSSGARQMASLLENYSYTYDYAVKATSSTSYIAEQIFVTVKTAKLSSGDNTAAVQAAVGGIFNGDAVIGKGKTLNVSANTTINGDLTIRGTVNVTGGAILTVNGTTYNYSNNTLALAAGSTLNTQALYNDGTLKVPTGSTLAVTTGDLQIDGGTADLAGTVTVAKGDVNLNGGNTTIKGAMTVAEGDLNINSTDTTEIAAGSAVTVTEGDVNIPNADSNVIVKANVTVNNGETNITKGAISEAAGGVKIGDEDPSAYTIAADTSIIALTIV